MKKDKSSKDKTSRGNASQFFVAGELCRRGYSAVVTLGNTPNTDILCSNREGTKFVHIQVKTFLPGNRTCSVGLKSQKEFSENFFWILGGIPKTGNDFIYYVIPASIMAKNVTSEHQHWIETPGKKGQSHKESAVRTVHLPPFKSNFSWDISKYEDRWDLIEARLK